MQPLISWIKRVLFWPFLLIFVGVVTYQASVYLLPYIDQPITKITLKGDTRYINESKVQSKLHEFSTAHFFSIDLPGMQTALENMPWIETAEVRRVWPNELQIKLKEQLPIARWGKNRLLNSGGEAFAKQDALHDYTKLPQLYGGAKSQQKVLHQYQVLTQMLRPLGFSIARLDLRERGSWFVLTEKGIHLRLGRDHLVRKIRRLRIIYNKELKSQIDSIKSIDLRYTNGIAIAKRNKPITAPMSEIITK
ncbi:UNVERIFIED_CONTAM: hypothetical protein GTU68_056378 [Idotea baltica]|nr:hypothetical protein [Idotea baltica]